MRLTQILERAAQANPSGIGTRHCGRAHTWPEVLRRVRCLAAGLAHLGLAPGDRVALLALNSDRFFEVIFAVAWAGGVLQPVNLRLAGSEIADQLADAGSRFLVFDECGLALLGATASEAALSKVEAQLFLGEVAVKY